MNLHSASLGKWNWKTMREAAISKHFLLLEILCSCKKTIQLHQWPILYFNNVFNSVCYVCMWKSLSRVWLFVTLWTVACQDSPSMGFFRQECWSGLPFSSLGIFPTQGLNPGSPTLQADSTVWATREALCPKVHLSGTHYLNDLPFKKYTLWGKSLKLGFLPSTWEFPGGPVVKTPGFQWAQVQSLVRELKSHMLHTMHPLHPTQKTSSLWIIFGLSTLLAYQGKTSISTVGTSTSAYRLSLATMSRSNTGTGTVWEQDSEPSQQASQDTLSRTDEEDEESRSPAVSGVGRWWGLCVTELGHANEDLGGFLPFWCFAVLILWSFLQKGVKMELRLIPWFLMPAFL